MKQIITLLVLFIGLSTFAQIDRSIRPTAGIAPAVNIPESEIFKLNNGITVILSQNNKTPRVSFSLVMGSEPSLEKEKAGLGEFAGNMILTGTNKLTKDEIDLAIDLIGATMSADHNSIYTSGLSKYSNQLLELMTSVLMDANFPEEEFKRLKTQTSSGLSMAKSDPNTIANNIVQAVIFGKKHPYGEVMTEETLNAISRIDVIDYFTKKFTPKNAYLVVVGDVSRAELEQLLNSTLVKWNGKEASKETYNHVITKSGNRVVFGKKAGAVQSVIEIAIPLSIKMGDQDEVKLKLLNQILGGGTFEARLMQNLREDKAYTYGCYSELSINRLGSYFSASGSFRNEVSDSAVVQIIKEMQRVIDAPVTKEELALAKASMTGSFVRALERPQTIANFALSIIRNNLSTDYYKNYLKSIDETTVEDIQQMAKKYLDLNNMNIIVVGNEAIADKFLPFDTDEKIEFFDAFGNPETGFKKTDMSADKIIENYLLHVTQSKTRKEAEQKIAKIKTVKQVMSGSPAGIPVTFEMISLFKSPVKEAMTVNFNGQMMQRTYFDGKVGGSEASPMAGGGSDEYTQEEVAEKIKTGGLFPELNYLSNAIPFKLLGIKKEMGKDYYVIETTGINSVTHNYYATDTFQKERSYVVTTSDEDAQSTNTEYRKFELVNGILFPTEMAQMAGSMSLTIQVKSTEINQPIDDKLFVK
jgi:zinc protease